MDMGNILSWLTGGAQATPSPPQMTPAPPMGAYPNSDDVAFAKKAGFGYGNPAESFIEGKAAQVLKPDTDGMKIEDIVKATKDPKSVSVIDTEKDPIAGKQLDDVYTKAALAVNRMPIAALGFEPRKAAMDVQLGKANLGGLYSPSEDTMWVNSTYPSALVHESTHRGINLLRGNPEAKQILGDMPNEEAIVRYLMAKQGGDDEKGLGGISDAQREGALYSFDKGLRSNTYQKNLQSLDKIAQDMIAKRNPRGPR